VQPPVFAQLGIAVLVAFWFDAFEQPLVGGRVAVACFASGQTVEVNEQDATRRVGQVAAVAVGADAVAGLQAGGFVGGDDEAGATEFEAALADASIRPQCLGADDIGADAQVGVDAAGFFGEVDVHGIAVGAAFGNDGLQRSRGIAGLADGHRDAHGSAAGSIHPRVVGDGPGQRQRRLGFEVVFEDAAVEGLFETVTVKEHPPEGERISGT
jgi:hypothetical protein